MDLSQVPLEQLLAMRQEGGAQSGPSAPVDLSQMSLAQLQALRDQVASANGPQTGMLESFWRGGVQGATLGAGDEAYAAGAGAVAKAQGQDFMPAYEQQLAQTQRNNKAASQANPWTYTAGQVVGAVPGLIAGGTTALGAKALGLVGRNLVTRSAAAGGTSAALGAVHGFAGTDGDMAQRAAAVPMSAAASGVLGAAGPMAGQAVGAGARAVMAAINPAARVPGISGQAAAMLADDVATSGGSRAVQQRMAELGPDAMLLDASPSLQGRAQGLAVRPETREAIQAPVTARNAGTNARLNYDVDAALGPAPIPSQIEAGLEAGRNALQPQYRAALAQGRAVDTRNLAGQLEANIVDTRGPAQAANRDVRGWLNIPGNAGQLDPNPSALLATRKAIDGRLATEANPDAIRALTMARQQVDAELAANVPGIKTVDAQYQELARQSGGLQRGSQLLDSGRTATRPQELADELIHGAQPQGVTAGPSATPLRMRQGLRGEIDRLLGNHANDLVKLRDIVKGDGDWNRAKLAQVFGHNEADRVFNAVDREAAFRNAYNKIVENSQTSFREQAAKGVTPRGQGGSTGGTDDLLTAGAGAVGGPAALAAALGVRGLRAANNAAMSASDIARNRELAQFLLRRGGGDTPALIDALERAGGAIRGNGRIAGRASTLAQLLLEGSGDPSANAYARR